MRPGRLHGRGVVVTRLDELKPGDVIDATGEIVLEVQRIGPVVIIDFTNRTSTAPLPGNATTTIRKDPA